MTQKIKLKDLAQLTLMCYHPVVFVVEMLALSNGRLTRIRKGWRPRRHCIVQTIEADINHKYSYLVP
jgi:hypothetical protein